MAARKRKTIFVSVASFVDPYLEKTLRSAMAQAIFPDQIVFGVLNQTVSPLSDRLALEDLPVRLLQVRPEESLGVAWARSVIQTLYDDEPYLLQIDSHMAFTHGWDEYLLETMDRLPWKSILTNYPYGFTWDGGRIVLDGEVSQETTLVIRPVSGQSFCMDSPVLRFQTRHLPERKLVCGCHIAAGFLFTRGEFLREVPYDPHWYFHGEEQALTLRAYTRGWDIYHPPHIPLYHLYKKPGQEHAGHHWNRRWKRSWEARALEERAAQRFVALLRGDLEGVWGLGQQRSLTDFAAMSGIDYEGGTICEPETIAGRLL